MPRRLDIDEVSDTLVGLASAAARDPRISPTDALVIVAAARALRDVIVDALQPAPRELMSGRNEPSRQTVDQGGADGRLVRA